MLIENHPGTKVVAMASTGSEALDIIAREPTDLIILNLELGGTARSLSFRNYAKQQRTRGSSY